jgi:cell division protein FtsB
VYFVPLNSFASTITSTILEVVQDQLFSEQKHKTQSKMSNIKERKQLGEVMRKIEHDISQLNHEIKNLKDGLVGTEGFVIQCDVEGFEHDASIINFTITPSSVVSDGKDAQVLDKEPIRFYVKALEGTIKGVMMSNLVETELGEWDLESIPITHEFSFAIEEEVQNVLELKITSVSLESLSKEISEKEAEVESLFKDRKKAKADMATLQQQVPIDVEIVIVCSQPQYQYQLAL